MKAAALDIKNRRKNGLIQTNHGNKYLYRIVSDHKSRFSLPLEKSRQFFVSFLVCEGGNVFFGNQNNIAAGGKQRFIQTKKLPQQSFNSIPFDGVARFFWYGNSQPFDPLRVATGNRYKIL